jgi:putative membrane protein
MKRDFGNAWLASATFGCIAVAMAGCTAEQNLTHGRDGEKVYSGDTTYPGNRPVADQSSSTHSSVASTVDTTPLNTTPVTATVVVPATNATTPAPATSTVLVPAPAATTAVVVPADQVPTGYVLVSNTDFMTRASQFNATEIALSRIAFQRAQSAAVRAFAQSMIEDHRQMAGDLDHAALSRGVTLAWTPNNLGADAISRLNAATGWRVDRYYLDQVIADHQSAVSLYRSEAIRDGDLAMRNLATAQEDRLSSKLDSAAELRTSLY